jgi:hypothetical protein
MVVESGLGWRAVLGGERSWVESFSDTMGGIVNCYCL